MKKQSASRSAFFNPRVWAVARIAFFPGICTFFAILRIFFFCKEVKTHSFNPDEQT